MSHAAPRRLLPWIALVVVWVVWGSTYLAMSVVVREMPPLVAAAPAVPLAGAIMALVALVVDRGAGWPSRRQWLDYALIGVLLLSVGNALVMGPSARCRAASPRSSWPRCRCGSCSSTGCGRGASRGRRGSGSARRSGSPASPWWPGRRAALDRARLVGVLALQVACLSWTAGSLYAQCCRSGCRSSPRRPSRCWPARS